MDVHGLLQEGNFAFGWFKVLNAVADRYSADSVYSGNWNLLTSPDKHPTNLFAFIFIFTYLYIHCRQGSV